MTLYPKAELKALDLLDRLLAFSPNKRFDLVILPRPSVLSAGVFGKARALYILPTD